MNLEKLNQLSEQEAYQQIEQACCAPNWITGLIATRPFNSIEDLIKKSDTVWANMQESDFLAAFEGHPKIGDVNSLKEKYRNTQGEASHEQSGVNEACDEIIQQLSQGNKDYFDKFGFIFIVFATGKSAKQMLDLLLARLPNDRQQELLNGAAEQAKITNLRLQKMLED